MGFKDNKMEADVACHRYVGSQGGACPCCGSEEWAWILLDSGIVPGEKLDGENEAMYAVTKCDPEAMGCGTTWCEKVGPDANGRYVVLSIGLLADDYDPGHDDVGLEYENAGWLADADYDVVPQDDGRRSFRHEGD